mmetsp:Transcript_6469/g.19199  ORF Transcript_6469/g.19199 Transcript_6469/m.19199 type:complete len:87 (+) Transcript_6469:1911-2171(+)
MPSSAHILYKRSSISVLTADVHSSSMAYVGLWKKKPGHGETLGLAKRELLFPINSSSVSAVKKVLKIDKTQKLRQPHVRNSGFSLS